MGVLSIIPHRVCRGGCGLLLAPGPNRPSGFLLTTALGIAGAFVATFIGQAVGWDRSEQGVGFIAANAGRDHRAVRLE